MFIVPFSSVELEKEIKKACEGNAVLEMGLHPVFFFFFIHLLPFILILKHLLYAQANISCFY